MAQKRQMTLTFVKELSQVDTESSKLKQIQKGLSGHEETIAMVRFLSEVLRSILKVLPKNCWMFFINGFWTGFYAIRNLKQFVLRSL